QRVPSQCVHSKVGERPRPDLLVGQPGTAPWVARGLLRTPPLRPSAPPPTEKLPHISHSNGLRLAYCVLPFVLAGAGAFLPGPGVFRSRRVRESAALNGN